MTIKQASDLHFTYVRNTPELRDAFIAKCNEFGIGVFGLGGENYLEVYSDGYDEFEICGTDDLEPQSKKLTMSDLTDIPTEKNRREEMTTYNSYQEAKIANPDKEIIRFDKQDEFKAVGNDELSAYLTTWTKCNPADHCMTVEKFLVDGHEVFMGDAIINIRGNVNYITQGDAKMINSEGGATFNNARYILRASALENIPTETPEEKEVLDGIESDGEVEWKSGDECEIEMQEGVRRYLFGCECPNNQQTCIVFTKDGGGHMVMPIERLKKPETPQQREDRERACVIYDMCAEADIFTEESNFWAGKFYDLGYKKEKTHGTN
ncbi:hypothetical protein NVP1263B_69 [Vibrio phage 1.263.B._10N.286.51.B1]|nr:hypothetical protein NVP1263A_69 [Vibrio phage 1.263.A._10N.286.51.B1]AUR99305.1 hypothetical protein NVP1263B_69 [Vibrio phage 1.263.B._10N.286.51.B1]